MECFDFVAGQFLSMKAFSNGKEITRAYSIASKPYGNNRFDICLNRVEGGFFSNYLCDMNEGEVVKFHGPHGFFVMRNPCRDSIFIATGTGIAPIRGMLHWLYEDPSRNEGRNFWLVFGARYDDGLHYDEEFKQLAAKHQNFHYTTTLSRGSEKWTGNRGYVQEYVKQVVGERTDMDAYICGLEAMVNANREFFKGIGWDKKQVVHEKFD
jgi:ferredoxin-NADP reductase